MQPTLIDPNAINRVKTVVDDLIDREHFNVVGSTLNAIGVGANRGAMGASLNCPTR